MGLVCVVCKMGSDAEEGLRLLPCENVACSSMYHRKCIRSMLRMRERFECVSCSSAESDKMESFEPTKTEPSAWHGSSQIKEGYGIVSDEEKDESGMEVVRKLNVETGINTTQEHTRDWKLMIKLNAHIKVEQKNPKTKGSKSYLRYEKYKNASTASEYLSLGGKREDFRYDMSHGFITDVDEKKRMEKERKRRMEEKERRKKDEEKRRRNESEKKRKSGSGKRKKKQATLNARKRRKNSFLRTLNTEMTTIAMLQRNPKRQDTKSFLRYQKYMSATTIRDYIDLGGTWADLRYDLLHEFAYFTGDNAKNLKEKLFCEYDSSVEKVTAEENEEKTSPIDV